MIEYRRMADGRIFKAWRPLPALDASPRFERVEPLSRTPAEERGSDTEGGKAADKED